MRKSDVQTVDHAAPTSPSFALSRLNQILLIVFVAQLALIAYLFWPSSTTASGELLLADLTADNISALTIADGNAEPIQFERSEDGGWTVSGTGGFPANADKVNEILEKLLTVKASRLVAQTAASHKRLQVDEDEFNRRLSLVTSSGEVEIYLGTSAGSGANHVRVEGQDATYLTGEIMAWELAMQPSGWIDTRYFDVPVEDIERVLLENESGEITFIKNEEGGWTIEDLGDDEEVNSADIASYVSSLTPINMIEPLGKQVQSEYGLEAPSATIVLSVTNEANEAATHTLTLGAKQEEDGNYPIKSSDSEFYVMISAFTGDELAGKSRDDFLLLPEEGVPEASTSEAAEPELSEVEPVEIDALQSPLATPSSLV